MKTFLTFTLIYFIPQFSSASVTIPKKYAWDKPVITVCWGTDKELLQTSLKDRSKKEYLERDTKPVSNNAKKLAQNLIESKVNVRDLGIKVTGFKDCEQTESYDIVIYFRKYDQKIADGEASLARYEAKEGKVRVRSENEVGFMIVILNEQEQENIDKWGMVFLHEFGHVLGLLHSDKRIKMGVDGWEIAWNPKENETCNINGYTANGINDKLRAEKVKQLSWSLFPVTVNQATIYDANSLMDYCYMNFLIWKTKENLHCVARIDGDLYTLQSCDGSKEDEIYVYKKDTSLISHNHENNQLEVLVDFSKADLEGIRCLYQYSDAEIEKFCGPSVNPYIE